MQLSHTRLPKIFEKSVGANTPGDDIHSTRDKFSFMTRLVEYSGGQKFENFPEDPPEIYCSQEWYRKPQTIFPLAKAAAEA